MSAKCHNWRVTICKQKGHFARDCKKPRKNPVGSFRKLLTFSSTQKYTEEDASEKETHILEGEISEAPDGKWKMTGL